MMAHELLRQAALILGAGWSKGCDARDDAGRIVPLYIGTDRARINPQPRRSRPMARSARLRRIADRRGNRKRR